MSKYQVMIEPKQEFIGLNKLVKQTDTEWSLEYQIPSTLSYFDGHFPNLPVLPAFGIVDLAQLILETHFGRKIHFELLNSKFLNLIAPNDKLKIKLQFKSANQCDFYFEKEGAKAAQLMLSF